jgi:hypothetical protein
MDLDRRRFLAAVAAGTLSARLPAASDLVFRPEDFGARGDGRTNDTAAFARLSAAVNRRGGGTIALTTRRTYVVGSQTRAADGMAWSPEPILELHHLDGPLTIVGNGARLIADAGLRFGTFDSQSGMPNAHKLPYTSLKDLAAAYRVMIWVHDCRAPVAIRDVELDGNSAAIRLGGKYGDTGWQVPATGLFLAGNMASEQIDNIYAHHHALDGAMFIGDARRAGRTSVSRLRCRDNGRQGLSITGGRGYDFADCDFSRSARGAIHSAPGAGVDIEAEHPPIRDLSFVRCKFVDNGGCGLVADSGDSADARFTDCRFVGTQTWSAWPHKPGFRFTGCTFVGSVVHPFADPSDPARAAQFTRCTFTDDPSLSPNGKLYLGGGPIVNMAASDNVVFEGCTFRLVAGGTLPWSSKATYRDCTMTQRSASRGYPKGKYLGRTTIDGNVNLSGSDIGGVVILNGRQLPPGRVA